MEFVTSRNFVMPSGRRGLVDRWWYNLWSRKLWPYEELAVGDTLFWYESRSASIVWHSQVTDVVRFSYLRKSEVATRLGLPRQEVGRSYFQDAPDSGFCLAYKVKPVERIAVAKPDDFRFPHQGWLRVTPELKADWRWPDVTSLSQREEHRQSQVRQRSQGLEEEFKQALLDQYEQSGEEVGYWGKRFRQALMRNGGVPTAKRMLQPRTQGQRKGLDALLEAGRPDLTTEAVILQPRFKSLFTRDELAEAARRLGEYGAEATRRTRTRERIYPDELEPGRKYCEGAKKQVRVNAYERNPKARRACLKYYGYRCAVCDLLFKERYGDLGKNFIHVHHLKPLALSTAEYELDPVNDLRPVCPNCHAMLHATDPTLTIEGLRELIAN